MTFPFSRFGVVLALLWVTSLAQAQDDAQPAPVVAPEAVTPEVVPEQEVGPWRGTGNVPTLEEATPPPSEELGMGWLLFRTLVVLGIVVASIYITLNYGLRKLMGLKGLSTGKASVVSVLERIPLDQKRALFLVKAGGEYLLLGGGEQALSLVAKLDSEQVERLQRENPPGAVSLSPFLTKLLSRRGGTPPPSA